MSRLDEVQLLDEHSEATLLLMGDGRRPVAMTARDPMGEEVGEGAFVDLRVAVDPTPSDDAARSAAGDAERVPGAVVSECNQVGR